jgi:thiaminase/transcriptional activator TenA
MEREIEAVEEDRKLIVPGFGEACLSAAGEAWGASFDHPFVRALAEGTLPAEKFKFYQMQDARYLEAFGDACALISVRCRRPDDKLWFIEAARLALVVESQLHEGYGARLGYTATDIAALSLSPDNRAYQNHMIAEAQRSTLVEAVAALAPCPWLYTDLGRRLEEEFGTVGDDHPYADWLRTYADPSFVTYTNELLQRLQRFADAADAEARSRAREAFAVSARYEWMFWQQAWDMQSWPV